MLFVGVVLAPDCSRSIMINDLRVCVCLWNDGTSGRNGESRIENERESESEKRVE